MNNNKIKENNKRLKIFTINKKRLVNSQNIKSWLSLKNNISSFYQLCQQHVKFLEDSTSVWTIFVDGKKDAREKLERVEKLQIKIFNLRLFNMWKIWLKKEKLWQEKKSKLKQNKFLKMKILKQARVGSKDSTQEMLIFSLHKEEKKIIEIWMINLRVYKI